MSLPESSLNDRLREILQQLIAELDRQSTALKSLETDWPESSTPVQLELCEHDVATTAAAGSAADDRPSSKPESKPKMLHFDSGQTLEIREVEGERLTPADSFQQLQCSSTWTEANRVNVYEAGQVAMNIDQQRRLTLIAMREEKTRHFQWKKPWYVINPESSKYATYWQFLTFAAMVFVAFVTPIQVGLFPIRLDSLLILSLCVDGIFLADMALQFFTMYPKRSSRGIIWEDRLTRITRHYLKTWFFLDFTTLVPFDLISLASGADSLKEFKGIKVVRVLRLLKLMRIFRTSKLIHKLEVALSIPYQQMALIRFLLILILVCHWMACLWAMTLNLADSYYPKWIDGIAEIDRTFGINTYESEIRIYAAAFYFCSYTMTSVGYGDIGPQNIFERITCTVIVLVAGLCWAYILGEVGAIVTDMNAEKQSFRKMMNGLNKMMQEQGLPHELRRRLRSFFLSNKHQAQFARDQKLLRGMSPQLQAEVSITLNWQWLVKVPFFREFIKMMDIKEMSGINTDPYRACIADVAHHMDASAYAQQEMFGESQVLYILSKGIATLNSRVALVGSVWGEDFVLADRDLIRRTSAFALIVRRYCVRMAAHRGILAQALKLKRQRTPQRLGKSGSQESKLESLDVKSTSSVPTPESERRVMPPVPGTLPEELSPLRVEQRSPRQD
ncbi:unnamed protein product [Cladocopium goreaui]|uniref:ATP-dependent RNA helicase DDX54 n=1 Tax=Cladocopium goreaui TaxID=2562237 RepID=A0A9P1C1K0_9DINO|nr:unnamed protein product [Cladocopium goreaui]